MTGEKLEKKIELLERRIVELEVQAAGSSLARVRKRRGIRWTAAAVVIFTLGIGGAVIAADGDCPNDPMPFCFYSHTPAKAVEINHNFDQIREWIEEKVGGVGSADVDVNGVATIHNAPNVATASGGGLLLKEGGATLRLDGNEIEADSDALYLNWNADLPVNMGGDLTVDGRVTTTTVRIPTANGSLYIEDDDGEDIMTVTENSGNGLVRLADTTNLDLTAGSYITLDHWGEGTGSTAINETDTRYLENSACDTEAERGKLAVYSTGSHGDNLCLCGYYDSEYKWFCMNP